MRGEDRQNHTLFSYVRPDSRIPPDHPLRLIRRITDAALSSMSEQFDAALSTWTLCTIPDADAALREVLRVLKPGATFHFVEHGHSPDTAVARWQERLEPLNKRLVGGCHLTRTIAEDIEHAGFVIDDIKTYYAKGAPKPWGYTFEGRARKI